jgi:hypothetical protein
MIFQVIYYLIPIYNRKNCCPLLFGRNCTTKKYKEKKINDSEFPVKFLTQNFNK